MRVLRVAQVDAGRLDDELVSLLREQFNRVFAMVFPGAVTRRQSELTLLLDALVFYFTVWSHRPTPGMELMNLRYRDERPSSSSSSSSSSQRSTGRTGMEGAKLSVSQRLLYGTAFVGGRFAWSKLRRAIGAGRWADEPEGSWRRVISTAVNALEATYSALALVNLLAFLNRGRYRTLTERALQTRLVYGEPHARRMVSYEYLNRQLVWREMSELALFVLPMVSAPGLRRAASRAFGRRDPRVRRAGTRAEGVPRGVVRGVPCRAVRRVRGRTRGGEVRVDAVRTRVLLLLRRVESRDPGGSGCTPARGAGNPCAGYGRFARRRGAMRPAVAATASQTRGTWNRKKLTFQSVTPTPRSSRGGVPFTPRFATTWKNPAPVAPRRGRVRAPNLESPIPNHPRTDESLLSALIR